MRTNFKKVMMPLAVVVFGAAAAFATNAAKQSEKAGAATMTGYFYDHSQAVGSKCQPVQVDCAVGDGPICTDLINPSITYWESPIENGLQCTLQLSRVN